MKNNQTVDRIQAIWNMIGGEEMVEALIRGRAKLEVKLIQTLNLQGTTTTSATTEKFVARKKFLKDSREVKFCGFFGSFENDFLARDGKIEEPLDEQTLCYGNLTKNSVDGPIIEEVGGKTKAETTLTELYGLLEKQANGEEGDLLTNGCANIFYIKNTSGVLRAVGVDWDDTVWYVYASSVRNRNAWDAGSRRFCRNS